MKFLRSLRLRFIEGRLPKRYAALQELQAEEHHDLVADVKARQRRITGELGDVILKLDAVSDNLQSALEELKDLNE